MSDQATQNTGITLPQSAVDSLKGNIDQAQALLDSWAALEKAGVALPGTKEQLQAVKDSAQKLIDNFSAQS